VSFARNETGGGSNNEAWKRLAEALRKCPYSIIALFIAVYHNDNALRGTCGTLAK